MLQSPAFQEALERERERRDPVYWAERHFYVADTQAPIQLAPHQRAVLRYAFRRTPAGRLPFQTVLYSTPKKGGKDTVAALVARWAAETWGRFGEVLCAANDAAQAKERAFEYLKQSIEVDPEYNRSRQLLPDRWRVAAKALECLPTGTTVKAVANDYQGEAGANPILTLWTELWGFVHRDDLRFWAEMAPSPTRPDSVRLVATYAGFEGESSLLEGLYKAAVEQGRQLTAGELAGNSPKALRVFEEAPNFGDSVPCWVNEAAGIFAYWDSGEQARRMPWQQGERGARYYAHEASTQTPTQFDRIHNNLWVSGESPFIPIEWWDACLNPLPLVPGERTPLVIGADAAVSGDCFGLSVVSRDPDNPTERVALRAARKWDPPPGGTINYGAEDGPEAAIRWFCQHFNVVQVAYDEHQLHDMMTRLQNEGVAWCRVFQQGKERAIGDKLFYDLIAHRRIRHDGNLEVRQHIANCNKKESKDDDSKLRLVKKSESRKIDLAVALSMAAAECLRLNL